jgi:hypothetical protein
MKIVSLHFEVVRATPAVAEFATRVELDGPAAGCEVAGRAVGPRASTISTVEVVYPLVLVESRDNAVLLKCVIPEPGLWRQKTPFIYTWSVEVKVKGQDTDTRVGSVILRELHPINNASQR